MDSKLRLVLAVLDLTVWPADATYVKNAIQCFASIVNLASRQNAGFVYLPMETTSTAQNTIMRHRRLLEDQLNAQGLDILRVVAVNFEKSGSSASDKRALVQHALLVTLRADQQENLWAGGNVWNLQSVGPVPLVKVSEMMGYDAESKPSPAQRVEQNFGILGFFTFFDFKVCLWLHHCCGFWIG